MSFLGDLGKVLMGRPLGASQPKQVILPGQMPPVPPVPTQSNGLLDDRGYRVVPRIAIEWLRPHRHGDRLTVTAYIKNLSDLQLRIESVAVLKATKNLNQILAPHESHQLTLYDGPAPHNENEHQARINYRLQMTHDPFQAIYRIGYHYDSDGTREINQLFPDGPVRTFW